jgi:hypothetical protein
MASATVTGLANEGARWPAEKLSSCSLLDGLISSLPARRHRWFGLAVGKGETSCSWRVVGELLVTWAKPVHGDDQLLLRAQPQACLLAGAVPIHALELERSTIASISVQFLCAAPKHVL